MMGPIVAAHKLIIFCMVSILKAFSDTPPAKADNASKTYRKMIIALVFIMKFTLLNGNYKPLSAILILKEPWSPKPV
jgi:hypothetical protein